MFILRSTLFAIGQILSMVVFAILSVIFIPMPHNIRYWFITRWSVFTIWWAKVICGIKYEVVGIDNIPATNGVVLCKHQSAWETLFLQKLFPTQTWVLKKELLSIPFFGWGLKLLEPIAIDRKKKSSIKVLISTGKTRLSQGRWVIIFPEGTRIPYGKVGRYTKSGALLAKKAQCPLIPITHNAGLFWPKNAFIKKPGTITIKIGPPIKTENLTGDEIIRQAQSWIEENISQP